MTTPFPLFLRTLCLLAFVVSTVPCSAAEEQLVSCRFVCMDGTKTPGALVVSGNEGEVPCEVPAHKISQAVNCPAKGEAIQFLSSGDRKPVASAKIPGGLKKAVLLFIPPGQAASAELWRVFVIDDSPGKFPDGGALVVNFYSKDIRTVIGEHRVQLHSATSHAFTSPKQRDDFNMVQVVVQFEQAESWRTASESLLRFLPGTRYLICAYVDPESGRPRITTINDIAPPVLSQKPG